MLPSRDRVAKCCAAEVLVLVSVLVCALATGTNAQMVPPPGTLAMSPAPSTEPWRSPRANVYRGYEFTPPSLWSVGLWGPSMSPSDSPSPRAPPVLHPLSSPSTNPFASGPARMLSSSPTALGPASGPTASQRVPQNVASPPSAELRSGSVPRLESQTVPSLSPPASSPGFVSTFSVPQSTASGPSAQDVSSVQSMQSASVTTLAMTAPAVAGPAAPSVPPPSVALAPGPSPGATTVVVKPGVVPAPAPAPAGAFPVQRAPEGAPRPPSPGAAPPAPSPMSQFQSPRNPFERASLVQSSSLPQGNVSAGSAAPGQPATAGNVTSSGSPGSALTPGATMAVAAAAPKALPMAANGTSPQLAQATAPTVATGGVPRSPAGMQKAAPAPAADNGLSTLNRVGSANALFPSLSAALAPTAAPASNPYNTLSPGTDPTKLSAMVVELLLTGQNLYPFSATDQYAVATTVNKLIEPYPHIVELSNIGIVAVITPGDTNGSSDSNNTAPDLALIGVPVTAPYPLPPASPAPAPAVLPPTPLGLSAPSSTSTSPAPSSTTPAPNPFMPPPAAVANSSVPPATTPAPALAAGLPIQPPSAASGRRMLMALSRVLLVTPTISYDVGGAQHVAVNCTIYASSRDLAAIQNVLSDSVKGGDFVQALNRTGLPVEKVEIVLFQQIAGPVAGPAPAPAPAPQLAQQIVGLPVTTLPAVVPVSAPAAPAPSGGPSKTVIIASCVSVAAAAALLAAGAAIYVTLWRRRRRAARDAAQKEQADQEKSQVAGQQNGGWNGQENGGAGAGGRKLRADGSINVRTENAKGGTGGSYEGISPDSVCGAQTAANGLASPARRAASGMSEWGAASDGTAVNSRDQLLSHQRATSSQHSAGSPHAQGVLLHNGDSGNYQRHAGVIMYDSAAETANRVRDAHLGRNGSGQTSMDFQRQGTLAGDLSLPSDSDTPHSQRTTSTPSSIGRLQRIGAAQLWQVHMEEMQIQKQIGEGSFGKVYLAKWKETTVAVKILTSTSGSSDDDFPTRLPNPLLQSLEKEAGMMAAMRHPNVVLYLGVCLDPPCVVTEYCARGSLNDVLKRALYNSKYAEQLDWRVRLSMALDAAKGMNYLHTSDPPVIHRDLKSPNLLVDKHWRVKVCDFNLSRVMEESAILSSMAATNPRWLAPEILAGRGYTFSSDIYSFGIILWEFMTWRVPWHEYGPWQVVAMVTDGHQRPEIPREEDCPSGLFPGVDEYIELMNNCWKQNAAERPSFAEIIQVLRRLLADEARRVANESPGDAVAARTQQASTSGSSADTARPEQGSSGEMVNGNQGSGDLAAVGGLRFQMAHGSSGDLRNGALPHAPGSPGPSGRADEPQHQRSESLGSDTHLQALAGRLGSGNQYGPEGLRIGESPRSRGTNSHEQYDSLGRGIPGYRDGGGGAGAGPLTRREGPDGSGQLSSNGDAQWDLARIHALLKEAHSDTSSNPGAEGPLSPPDSRLSSLVRTGLPPVDERRDERNESPRSHPLPGGPGGQSAAKTDAGDEKPPSR